MAIHGVTDAEATIYAIGLDNATERTANRSAELLELATDVDTQSLKRCLERFDLFLQVGTFLPETRKLFRQTIDHIYSYCINLHYIIYVFIHI